MEQGDIRDIKPPLAPPLWPFLLWGVVLAAAAALIIREVRRRLKSAGAGGGTPESLDLRPPHVRALEALERLGAEDIPPKEFYIRLSDILRIYLEGRFGIPAMFLTTQDLNRRMREAEMDRAVVSPVKDLFERADLVKFAKFMPEKRERDGDLGIARDIILKTAPPEPPAKSIDKRGNGGYNQGQAGEKINE